MQRVVQELSHQSALMQKQWPNFNCLRFRHMIDIDTKTRLFNFIKDGLIKH